MPTPFSLKSAPAVKLAKKPLGSETGSHATAFTDFRLQLSHCLQSSLDLMDVLSHFQQMMQRRVPHSGVGYRYPKKHVNLSIGSSRAHSASYNLNIGRHYLGEMIFYRANRFAENELQEIEALLGLLVQPLRNALLYRDALEQSLRDPLTGLGNRSALDDALKREFKVAKRAGQPLSLVIADIDFFKQVNDSAGHPVGDQFIKDAAQAAQKAVRQTDQVFRFGGEEYVVILAATQHNDAMMVAERIRHATAAISIDSKAGPISATMSLGVSTLRCDDSKETLFERADDALYLAKAGGRDAVVSAENESEVRQRSEK